MAAGKMFFTAKKRAYVEARLSGKNITDSAIKAGYSPATARAAGSRLEKDADVKAAIFRYTAEGKTKLPKNPPQAEPKPTKSAPKTKKKPVEWVADQTPDTQKTALKMPDWSAMLAPPTEKKTAKKAREKDNEPESVPEPQAPTDDPMQFWRDMMKDTTQDPRLRLEASKALAAYTLNKPSEKGKKEEQADAAKDAAKKFGSIPPPKLNLVKK